MDRQGDTFIIKAPQENMVELLNEPDNLKQLETAFNFFGVTKFKIVQNEKLKTDDDNIKILNKYFNDEVIIKSTNKK